MVKIDTAYDYVSMNILPYISIDWSEEAKERGVKTCISIGWLFWELYIDFI